MLESLNWARLFSHGVVEAKSFCSQTLFKGAHTAMELGTNETQKKKPTKETPQT